MRCWVESCCLSCLDVEGKHFVKILQLHVQCIRQVNPLVKILLVLVSTCQYLISALKQHWLHIHPCGSRGAPFVPILYLHQKQHSVVSIMLALQERERERERERVVNKLSWSHSDLQLERDNTLIRENTLVRESRTGPTEMTGTTEMTGMTVSRGTAATTPLSYKCVLSY